MSKVATVIAIDGPAGVGKSTIGSMLAQRLGYLYLDTGVLYRTVSYAALKQGVAVGDAEALQDLAHSLKIEIRLPSPVEAADERQYTVLLDGEDITWGLRTPQVEAVVSEVSAIPGVRAELREYQRAIAAPGRIVVMGRDIGTVVLPDADLKIYLDAPLAERARRRHQERVERGEHPSLQQVVQEVAHRDDIDSHRATSPLHPADDAVIVQTGGREISEVLAACERLVQGAAS